ncbi:MAG TPA: 2-C-methyl-D-erythritol 4-phosphate cytidylyltransferase [Vicinamibacterales bacterium]|nr:2-C-methyl-D-erythritol 4-phosphate cytidylyltransferase [Vicinamibacterales bacterium]
MYVTAIIAAGGRGERFGAGVPKQLVEIDGRSILERSVEAFLSHDDVNDLVVALPRDLAGAPPAYLKSAAKPVKVVAGGSRRQDSVAAAFTVLSDRTDVVVIHDAARPFATRDLISRTIAAAAQSGAALAALEARDTVKSVRLASLAQDRQPLLVDRTLDRRAIYLAQTPQAFRRDVLRDALAMAGDATDEAALAEQAGHAVTIVAGEASNIKITTPEDLVIAEAIARRAKPARTGRAGFGYDLHRLVEGRPLILGGVTIPFEKGLAGHSDADAICHAITDAILGAAGAGDIGRHFPDSDPKWKGASSIDLLRQAVAIVRTQGLAVGNVDATVILERPRLAPHVDAMRARLAEVLGVSVDRVSIKGKTNEGVGELGRGEAIAVHAIAMVRSL